jgi:hypothetical protein
MRFRTGFFVGFGVSDSENNSLSVGLSFKTSLIGPLKNVVFSCNFQAPTAQTLL